MTPKQFEQSSQLTNKDAMIDKQLASVYGCAIPESVVAVCATAPEGDFLDGPFCRKLSFGEIVGAKDMLHVDFPNLGLIPVFDCSDNDFIVFCLADGKWTKFNIVDEVAFRKSEDWKNLIQNTDEDDRSIRN